MSILTHKRYMRMTKEELVSIIERHNASSKFYQQQISNLEEKMKCTQGDLESILEDVQSLEIRDTGGAHR